MDNKSLNDENRALKENYNRLSLENQTNYDNFVKVEVELKELKFKFDKVLKDNEQFSDKNRKLES